MSDNPPAPPKQFKQSDARREQKKRSRDKNKATMQARREAAVAEREAEVRPVQSSSCS